MIPEEAKIDSDADADAEVKADADADEQKQYKRRDIKLRTIEEMHPSSRTCNWVH